MNPKYTVKSNSTTFHWKNDASADEIPAYVYYGAEDSISHPIGEVIRTSIQSSLTVNKLFYTMPEVS